MIASQTEVAEIKHKKSRYCSNHRKPMMILGCEMKNLLFLSYVEVRRKEQVQRAVRYKEPSRNGIHLAVLRQMCWKT